MAELILKIGTVGPDPSWQDGDVIDCFNDRRIRQIHAELICSYTRPPLNPEGNGEVGTLADFMHAAVCTYRYQPISDNLATRTRLADGRQDTVSIREAHKNKHTIAFGLAGEVYWYGGQQLFTDAALDLVWAEIEARTPLRAADHTLAPLGRQDLRSHLAIKVDDFSEQDRLNMTTPSRTTRKRDYRVPFRTALALSQETIDAADDPRQAVDLRDRAAYPRAVIVQRKL